MYTLVIILAILVALLLTFIVVIQNSKGGGLSSTFAGSSAANQILGTRRTGDFVEKATWYLFSALAVLCFVANFALSGTAETEVPKSKLDAQIENMKVDVSPTSIPSVENLKKEEPPKKK
jgi:preprotein translocase subunit SecG